MLKHIKHWYFKSSNSIRKAELSQKFSNADLETFCIVIKGWPWETRQLLITHHREDDCIPYFISFETAINCVWMFGLLFMKFRMLSLWSFNLISLIFFFFRLHHEWSRWDLSSQIKPLDFQGSPCWCISQNPGYSRICVSHSKPYNISSVSETNLLNDFPLGNDSALTCLQLSLYGLSQPMWPFKSISDTNKEVSILQMFWTPTLHLPSDLIGPGLKVRLIIEEMCMLPVIIVSQF